jgi:hypothetical protein
MRSGDELYTARALSLSDSRCCVRAGSRRHNGLGTYTAGVGEDERVIAAERAAGITISRPGYASRNLFAAATDEVFPSGVPPVRIRFTETPAPLLTIADGPQRIEARRM